MPSVTSRQMAIRDQRWATLRERVDAITTAYPTVNRHLAGEMACTDRLWGADEGWRTFVADANVAPCLLSCCNPTD